MDDYMFILGRDFQLSLLEIESFFASRNIEHKLKFFDSNLAIISLPDIDFKELITSLGGTVKIAKTIKSIDHISIPNLDKIKYSILSINSNKSDEVIKGLKVIFKREGIKAIYKHPSKNIGINPSDFFRQNIFETGFEVILYKDIIAITIAVFNPKWYEARDKRPYLPGKELTSIRLAKILVNLSQVKEDQTLLDPFCGAATILQEALLMKMNVIGMEIDSRKVFFAKKNLKWLQNNYHFKQSFMLINKDAASAASYIEKADGVATEYLGPNIKRVPLLSEAERAASEIAVLHSKLFGQLKLIMKKGKVVIVAPRFKTREQIPVSINVIELAKQHGFRPYNPLPAIRLPVLCSTKGTNIQKEIYIMERV